MKHVLLLLSFVAVLFAQAQQAEYVEGQILVQTIKGDEAIYKVVKDLTAYDVKVVNRIAPTLDIWLLTFDATMISQEKMLREIGLHSNILIAQNNHKVDYRDTTPNDPEFDDQWQYINAGNPGVMDADIDAELAWDITTGGMTPLGDEIVICVIDDGINPDQNDFTGNLWTNTQEVANNGIDDDQNGFIDDVDGWSAYSNNDNVFQTGYTHGTSVACIVGCKGNNNVGVTGVNWDVKLMIVQGGGNEAQALAAYAYPLAMRKLYNQTGGQKGAFVVATNASWGVDYGQASQAPLWCAIYDSLGQAGVMNAGATINGDANVDVEGDLPTQCGSDYLITVTNLGRYDTKVPQAGYGQNSIDLGSFGAETHTAESFGNGYGPFGGTSGATPHVAGAIGLLYSTDCPSFANLYSTDPAMAALKTKEYIMNGADANASLVGITVSESRLNLHGALLQLEDECLRCPTVDATPVFSYSSQTEALFLFSDGVPSDTNFVEFVLQYREVGTSAWITVTSPTQLIEMENLTSGVSYEYQFAINCQDGMGEFGSTSTFIIPQAPPTSIEDMQAEYGIQLYPNPTTSEFTINIENLSIDFTWTVYDIAGKELMQGNIETSSTKLDLTTYQTGVYLLKMQDEKGNSFTQRVIKQ